MNVFNSVNKLFCFQNAHWQHVAYQNVMVSTCYHNIVNLIARTAHMYEHMHACTAYIRRTRAVVQATPSVTHTKSYQVIHQLIGTNNVQLLRETARAEKAQPAPAT